MRDRDRNPYDTRGEEENGHKYNIDMYAYTCTCNYTTHFRGTLTSSDTKPSTSCRDNSLSMATTSAGFMEPGTLLPGGRGWDATAPAWVVLLSPVAGVIHCITIHCILANVYKYLRRTVYSFLQDIMCKNANTTVLLFAYF